YAENCVGQSARVGRGPAEFTPAGRDGACRPYETRLERRNSGSAPSAEVGEHARRGFTRDVPALGERGGDDLDLVALRAGRDRDGARVERHVPALDALGGERPQRGEVRREADG